MVVPYLLAHAHRHFFFSALQLNHIPAPPLPQFDAFLKQRATQVTRQNLQLVGVTAMLLASKYEEIYPPQIRDLVFITDRAYNRDQILEMESTMANALEFRLTVPTIYCFLLRYLKVMIFFFLLLVLSFFFKKWCLNSLHMRHAHGAAFFFCSVHVSRFDSHPSLSACRLCNNTGVLGVGCVILAFWCWFFRLDPCPTRATRLIVRGGRGRQ